MFFDYPLFRVFQGLVHQNKFLDGIIVFLAVYLQYFLLAAALYLLFKKEKNRRRRFFVFLVFVFAAILSRGLLTETVRFFWSRSRPFAALGFSPLINGAATASFPSGHMAFCFALALTVFLLDKKWAWFFVGAVLLMGLCRIAAGIHWPLDIAAGIAVATASYFVARILLWKIVKIQNCDLSFLRREI